MSIYHKSQSFTLSEHWTGVGIIVFDLKVKESVSYLITVRATSKQCYCLIITKCTDLLSLLILFQSHSNFIKSSFENCCFISNKTTPSFPVHQFQLWFNITFDELICFFYHISIDLHLYFLFLNTWFVDYKSIIEYHVTVIH